jgi:hypothetical protein
MGGGGLAKMLRDKFSLVISLVKVNKSLCHVTQGGGGEGEEEMSTSVKKGGGSKKFRKSFAYYLNGPLVV